MRSDAHGAILAYALLAPGEESLSAVAEATGVPLTTVQREVSRLVDAGVLEGRKQGNTRLIRASDDYPLLTPLRQIVAATYGPQPVIADHFSTLDSPLLLAIFGSWAARMQGEPGAMPADIDVLIVGDVDELDADDRAVKAGREIAREVNPVVIDPQRWDQATDGFVREIRSRPLVVLRDSLAEQH